MDINCPECDRIISSRSKKCPFCGFSSQQLFRSIEQGKLTEIKKRHRREQRIAKSREHWNKIEYGNGYDVSNESASSYWIRKENWSCCDDKKEFIEKYTDIELENKIREYAGRRENRDKIYYHLGQFKKNNPEWCAANEIPAFKDGMKVPNMTELDWYNVDKKKFDLCEHIDMATQMVTNSLGVWTEKQAEILFSSGVSPNKLRNAYPSYSQFIAGIIDKNIQ